MANKVPASDLKLIQFPDCYASCAAVECLGVGECESVCPYKFNLENGEVKDFTPEDANKHWNKYESKH